MFVRKIQKDLQQYFTSAQERIMIGDGARQFGKSFIIRYEGQKLSRPVEI